LGHDEPLPGRCVCDKQHESPHWRRPRTNAAPAEAVEGLRRPPTTPCVFIDAFVASLDRHALGFAKASRPTPARRRIIPADLLRLYLYGLPAPAALQPRAGTRVPSQLGTALACLRKLAPDFKTIADFRRDQRAASSWSIASSIQRLPTS